MLVRAHFNTLVPTYSNLEDVVRHQESSSRIIASYLILHMPNEQQRTMFILIRLENSKHLGNKPDMQRLLLETEIHNIVPFQTTPKWYPCMS